MISLQKEHELKSYETAGVSFGLFLNFTFVTMRGPNKTIETELKKLKTGCLNNGFNSAHFNNQISKNFQFLIFV